MQTFWSIDLEKIGTTSSPGHTLCTSRMANASQPPAAWKGETFNHWKWTHMVARDIWHWCRIYRMNANAKHEEETVEKETCHFLRLLMEHASKLSVISYISLARISAALCDLVAPFVIRCDCNMISLGFIRLQYLAEFAGRPPLSKGFLWFSNSLRTESIGRLDLKMLKMRGLVNLPVTKHNSVQRCAKYDDTVSMLPRVGKKRFAASRGCANSVSQRLSLINNN